MVDEIVYLTAGLTRNVVAVDAASGETLWMWRPDEGTRFDTAPRKGARRGVSWWRDSESADSWKDNSASYTGNTGVWATMSGDPALGLIYLPVETPTGDFYGGLRKGDNRYANSLVCLDIKTGKVRWHYQISHHDIWDYDLPFTPVLADIPGDKGPVKAVVQVTKQAFAFVFNRETGEPIWPIEERPVPQSDVPGEETSFSHRRK